MKKATPEVARLDPVLSVRDRIATGVYTTKLGYATNQSSRSQREAYELDLTRLKGVFMEDSLKEVGISTHPKASECYTLAWEMGQSYGYEQVLTYLEKFASLLK